MLCKYLLLVIPLVSLPGCTIGTSGLPVSSSATLSTSESLAVTGTAIPAKKAEIDITNVGTVMDVSLSARIMMLESPVEGIRLIALTEECNLVNDNWEEITLVDKHPGLTKYTIWIIHQS